MERDGDNPPLVSGPCCSNSVRRAPGFVTRWKQRAQRLQKEAEVFYLVFKHPRTRWYARLVAACSAAYLFSPIQLIPNWIPVIGSLDDLLVLFLGAKLLQRITPAYVLIECRELAEAAEKRRKEEARWTASVAAPIVIATVWILGAIIASTLMTAYIYR